MCMVEQTNTVYVALDLLTWQQQGVVVLSPKFQRRSVWSPGARSYFIDTILRGYPVPPIHLRTAIEPTRGVVREVIDGQQRLRALFDFVGGKYRLPKQLDAPWAGKAYDDLSDMEIQSLMEFRFQVYQYQGIDDATVLEIFQRINTYSVPLNAQELRHGKYFGEFRQSVYDLAFQHLTFWRDARIFTEGAIARMNEAELVSELLILQLDGLQDKKKSIGDFYAHLDEEWGRTPLFWSSKTRSQIPMEWMSREKAEKRFSDTVDEIAEAIGAVLPTSEFRRVPLFYTLYGAVHHRLFGVPGLHLETPKKALDRSARSRLLNTMEQISDLVSEKPDIETLTGWRQQFLVASARQTDNLAPRVDRLNVLWKTAELGS